MYSSYFKIKLLFPILLIFTLSTACSPGSRFFCRGCYVPPSGPAQPAQPAQSNGDHSDCAPGQPVGIQNGKCGFNIVSSIGCNGKNDIITLHTSGIQFRGSVPGFTCTTSGINISCTGPKLEPGTALNITVCGPTVSIGPNECKDQSSSFWNEDLKRCLPLGSSCCPTGQEWSTALEKCIPIVMGNGNATETDCSGEYQLFSGFCVLKNIIGTCCTSVSVKAPCCYSSCASGYHLNPNTHCCDRTAVNPCANVNCNVCMPLKDCPNGCCY